MQKSLSLCIKPEKGTCQCSWQLKIINNGRLSMVTKPEGQELPIHTCIKFGFVKELYSSPRRHPIKNKIHLNSSTNFHDLQKISFISINAKLQQPRDRTSTILSGKTRLLVLSSLFAFSVDSATTRRGPPASLTTIRK